MRLRPLLPLAALAVLALGLSAAASSTPTRAAAPQAPPALATSSPWSGTIAIDYEQDGGGAYSAVGSVKTTLRLTKPGPVVHDGQEQFTQRGSWSSTIDLTFPEDCHSVHIAGTFGGQAKVLTWHWNGNNTWYMGMGPSPQPSFQIPFTKTEDTCNLTQYDLTGHMYWLLAVGEDSYEWFHHAGPCAHTLSGAVHPGIQSIDRKTTVRYQLTQLPDANADGVPDGGNSQTGTCGGKKPPPPPPPPPGNCGASALKGCPPPDPYKTPDSYSMAGACGTVPSGSAKGQPRCYIMLGQKTILAVKDHEAELAGFVQLASGKIIKTVGLNVAKNIARNQLISYAIKKLTYGGVATAYSGYGFGQLLGKVFVSAAFAVRWHDLGRAGYPPKCFNFEVTLNGTKPKPAFDVIWSFVRTWDRTNPPSYRGITTSNAHWWHEGHSYLLPMFCRGPHAQAVATGSEVPTQLLAPPYIGFNVDFAH